MDEDKRNMSYTNSSAGLDLEQTDDKGKNREKRNNACQHLKILGMLQLMYGVIFIGVVIAQLAVAAQGVYQWPLLNPGPWIISTLMVVAGGMALMVWRRGEQYKDLDEPPLDLKELFFRYWLLCHLLNVCFISWSSSFAFMAVGRCGGGDVEKYPYCLPYREANIALTAIVGSFCMLCLVFIVPVYYIYCRSACAFGMKGCRYWC